MLRTWWMVCIAGSLLLGLGGCEGASDAEAPAASNEAQPHYVVTLPVLASIVQPVVSGRATTQALLDVGDSPHTFDPRPSTVQAARQSTALFYGADVLDGWAAQVQAPAHHALLDMLPDAYVRRFGDDAGAVPRSDPAHGAEAHAHGAGTRDPHFWLDPVAVRALMPALADTLCALDPEGCDTYRTNAQAVADSLQALHRDMEATLQSVQARPFMASQPFLHYLVRRYGLTQAAVIEASPAHEPSARRIHQLTEQAQAQGVVLMVRQRQLPATAAQAVAEGAALPMVALDPLGGPSFDTYPALMRHNAATLRQALAP